MEFEKLLRDGRIVLRMWEAEKKLIIGEIFLNEKEYRELIRVLVKE